MAGLPAAIGGEVVIDGEMGVGVGVEGAGVEGEEVAIRAPLLEEPPIDRGRRGFAKRGCCSLV